VREPEQGILRILFEEDEEPRIEMLQEEERHPGLEAVPTIVQTILVHLLRCKIRVRVERREDDVRRSESKRGLRKDGTERIRREESVSRQMRQHEKLHLNG